MAAIQLDILTAIAERDRGIQQAIMHADAVEENWQEMAFALLKEFLHQEPAPFMVEDLRAYAAVQDFPLPPHARAWGAVILRASKVGLVINAGYGKTRNAKAHRTPAAIWKRASFIH